MASEPQLFIEMFNYRDEWAHLSKEKRECFASSLAGAMEKLPSMGIKVVGWGMNSRSTDRRAPYDFYCAYQIETEALVRKFEAGVASSDWYKYFDQVIISGPAGTPADLLVKMAAAEKP